jgi:hypothetical protein
MLFEYNYPSLDQNILQMVFRISLVNALRSHYVGSFEQARRNGGTTRPGPGYLDFCSEPKSANNGSECKRVTTILVGCYCDHFKEQSFPPPVALIYLAFTTTTESRISAAENRFCMVFLAALFLRRLNSSFVTSNQLNSRLILVEFAS